MATTTPRSTSLSGSTKMTTDLSSGVAGYEAHETAVSESDLKLTRQTFIFALCAAVNSCNLGYDVGVSTNAGALIQRDMGLTDVQREAFIGSLNMWSIFGSLFAHWICDRYGRRHSFKVAAIGFIIGLVIMAVAPNYTVLMIGRVFVGLGVGFGLAIDPLYIAEISPAAHRGRLVTWSEIAINIGLVFGFFSGIMFYGMDDAIQWRLMFAMGCILPIIMIILVQTVMPESPRFLVEKQRVPEAKEILKMLYPEGFNVDPIVRDIQEAIERERMAEQNIGWNIILFPTPAIRRMLIVGVATAVSQQAVGIDAIQYYLIDILKESGIENEKSRLGVLMLLGMVKLVFIFVGGYYFDKSGRRPLFFISLIGMIAALILVAFSYMGDQTNGTGWAIGGLALYMAMFSVGVGPGAWLIPSEIFATSIRAKAMSVATFCNRITATIMASTFLSTVNWLGNWGNFFFLLAGISAIVLVFVYYMLPETKGRSLEDMSIYFAEITSDTSLLEAEKKILQQRNGGGVNVEMSTNFGAGAPSGNRELI